MDLKKEQLEKLAKLANLKLSKADISTLKKEIPAILKFVNTLEKAETGNTSPVSQTTGLENILRDDSKVIASFSQEIALSQAKEAYKTYFKTKGILKNEE
jgi:aspartyl/glutamyl-tRNA(Asn/Gln) amidotransferase C subunit